MNQPALDCLCVGIVVADHICEPVDHVPAAGELVLTPRMDLSIGGCASNVAVDLAKLGHTVSVVGKVGADPFGRYVADSLQTAGVETSQLVISADHDTSGTLVINTRGEDRRFIHSIGANGAFNGEEISIEMINSARVLYLGGYCLMDALSAEKVAELFQQAQAAGIPTLLDVVIPGSGDYWSRLRPVLPYTDVFLPNDDESRLITGLDDPVAQGRAFREAGAKTVVITCGDQGSVLLSEDRQLAGESFQVEFVDGTGSGDAFVAGFIHGLLNHADARTCLCYGSALGASCVRATGASTGVFDREELNTFLRSNELPIRTL